MTITNQQLKNTTLISTLFNGAGNTGIIDGSSSKDFANPLAGTTSLSDLLNDAIDNAATGILD
jgi:hypothetical protein